MSSSRRMGLFSLVLSAALVAGAPARSAASSVQFSGRVLVGPDGNGVTAATFPTTQEGELVHAFLIVSNGCKGTRPQCRNGPPVQSLQVVLNGDVVFSTDSGIAETEVGGVALRPVGGSPNLITVSANGDPGNSARFVVVTRNPSLQPVGGWLVVPLARTSSGPPNNAAVTTIYTHNVGAVSLRWRLEFYNNDGSFAGLSLPSLLMPKATAPVDLETVVTDLGLSWTTGAVHLRWVAPYPTQLKAVGANSVSHLVPLDEIKLAPVNHTVLDEFAGGAGWP